MTHNGTLKAWKRDEDTGGDIDSAGRYVPGASVSYFVEDWPCLVQAMMRGEIRDESTGKVLIEPGRISLDYDHTAFEVGDYISVTYRSEVSTVTDREGEVRKRAFSSRGRRNTILYVEWLN